REFMYVDDMAAACVFVMKNYSNSEIINIGTGKDVTIRQLAEIIIDVAGYEGELRFDESKPDGMPRKLLDVSRLKSFGWTASTDLKAGIAKTYEWYLSALENGDIRM
ncbi:MAG TPA: NAD-dependent epimerase/dehydratase family protein, partial [Nitrospirae bacterium]|nr:NAD-dependent epimerase/dehydratase family protein [Nitrospirota bacterium]